MRKIKHRILSTASLSKQLIEEAALHDIAIDSIPFIKTKEVEPQNLKDKIEIFRQQNITAVFTSTNAVNAVLKYLKQKPGWTIYCMSGKTKEFVESNFQKESIAGIAESAGQLAELIINDNVKRVVFFCGDQRRDELPVKLKEQGIYVEEVVVYSTTQTPIELTAKYDGILFFSPSAVDSFFSINHVDEITYLFAIGLTTAKTIQQYNKNNIIISPTPSKENIVKQIITHFNTIKNDQTVL